ncbi:MAG TPA: alpha/beta hydrolase [Ideonella sp.]|nr:alpha/beta hydrolase [Ideonella sp.]
MSGSVDLFFDGRERRDFEYNARNTVPDFTVFTRQYTALTAAAKGKLGGHFDLAYDAASRQTLDLVTGPAGDHPKPVLVFIHGGYWRGLSKHEAAPMAEAFVKAGVAVAAVDYGLAPATSLAEIVRQNRAAVAWLYHHAGDYGLDPRRIHVAGSSAGGHLVGMLLAPGWHAGFGVPQDVIRGATTLSGLFDLQPLVASHINEWLRLGLPEARALSPLWNLPAGGCPLLLAVGALETQGFQRQTAAYAQAWREAVGPADVMTVPERHHFDIVLDLADENSALARAVLSQIHGTAVMTRTPS